MKRLITALLIVSGLCSPFLLSAQDSWQSLINRLTYYSPEKYKSAIDNLKKKYPDSYHPDKDWEKALSELKTDKETLISGLKAKDPKAEKQAKKLLKQLDAALLALTAGLLVLGDIGDAFDNHRAGLGVDGQDLALLALDGLIAVLGTGDDDDLVVLFDMNLIHSSILPITALREPAKRSS